MRLESKNFAGEPTGLGGNGCNLDFLDAPQLYACAPPSSFNAKSRQTAKH
jgi:hypothetical protein